MPALGLVGCAWATLIVNWLLLVALWLLRTPGPVSLLRLWQRIEPPDWHQLAASHGSGCRPAWRCWSGDLLTLMALFIARLGTAAAAAHQIASNLTALAYMVPLSLASRPVRG